DEQDVDTLIFVLDGALRSVPMGALYDGENYLIEKYAIDVVLGLDIPDPKPLARNSMNILAAGLKVPPEGFKNSYAVLAEVPDELERIEKSGISSTILQEDRFTQANFNRVLNQDSYDVIHLATHGQFSANRDDTFLLDANGKITLDELPNLFGATTIQASAVELLVLSACRTATGNDRDVLGIAGTTVRAGAQSAIASLWSIDDQASVIFTETFYKEIGKDNVSRAQALQKAQQALMSNDIFDHPRYWSPYILVGNWL
ncbi:MAG: CHAT domain-containing protein, partial [Cyanothece sp. SIO2G6]|nr:CHAT domain-containing protein [Cyanothece sp. SIO2G6]